MIGQQRPLRLVTDTGKVMGIGTLRTIDMVKELDGQDTEIMEGWGQEDAGNNRIQGAIFPPDQQTLKSKTTDK